MDFGKEEINGEKYNYCVYVQTFESGGCWLVKHLDKTLSARNNRRIEILYSEKIGEKYTCEDWVNVNLLSQEQHSHLKNFLNNYERNIQYLEYANIEEVQKSSFTKSADSKIKEAESDSAFIAYENGVVRDKMTGLEWMSGPDEDTTWYEAKSWVENLNVAGGGWRMPTISELRSLFQEGSGTRNMNPLLKTSGWHIWSSETKGSKKV